MEPAKGTRLAVLALMVGWCVLGQAEDIGPFRGAIAFGDASKIAAALEKATQDQKDQAVIAALRNYVDPMYSTGGSKSGYIDIVRELLAGGADPNAYRLSGYQPPARSGIQGAPGVSVLSRSSRAPDPQIVPASDEGASALQLALDLADGAEDHPMVEILIAHGATSDPGE